MFQAHELVPFPHLNSAVRQPLPSAALVGAAWTQTGDDPFFAEINPTAMGYRSAPRGFANSDTRRGVDALGRALLRFGRGNRHCVGA